MSLLNCAPCLPSCLRDLPIIDTHLRAYVPARLRALPLINTRFTRLSAQAPLLSSIRTLRAFVLSCYKYCCVCRPSCKKGLIQQEVTMDTRKDVNFQFWTRNTLFGQIWPKNQNCQSKVKFGTQTNSHMQNFMAMFTFPFFDQKYPFWVILVQKIKIVSLS